MIIYLHSFIRFYYKKNIEFRIHQQQQQQREEEGYLTRIIMAAFFFPDL